MKPSDVQAWFAARGWRPFGFQREVWDAVAKGQSGLLHATTGAGKTYALWFGALLALSGAAGGRRRSRAKAEAPDAATVAAEENLFAQPAQPLAFPAWFVPNWDALEDVLLIVLFVGIRRAPALRAAPRLDGAQHAAAARPARDVGTREGEGRASAAGSIDCKVIHRTDRVNPNRARTRWRATPPAAALP